MVKHNQTIGGIIALWICTSHFFRSEGLHPSDHSFFLKQHLGESIAACVKIGCGIWQIWQTIKFWVRPRSFRVPNPSEHVIGAPHLLPPLADPPGPVAWKPLTAPGRQTWVTWWTNLGLEIIQIMMLKLPQIHVASLSIGKHQVQVSHCKLDAWLKLHTYVHVQSKV